MFSPASQEAADVMVTELIVNGFSVDGSVFAGMPVFLQDDYFPDVGRVVTLLLGRMSVW